MTGLGQNVKNIYDKLIKTALQILNCYETIQLCAQFFVQGGQLFIDCRIMPF